MKKGRVYRQLIGLAAFAMIASGSLLMTELPAFAKSAPHHQVLSHRTAPVVNMVSVANFGALGNGIANDTQSIQNAINAVAQQGGGVVYIPNGVYMVDATKSIQLKSNVSLQLSSNAVLQAIPNSDGSYAILEGSGVQNVSISGGTIQGERNQHLGTSGEWGMGVKFYGVQNVTISNLTVDNCWGDGIYIGEGQNQNNEVTLNNVVVNNNRRNGITIVNGQNITISNCTAENSNGTAPADGIDIEPNHPTDLLQNINITDLTTSNNAGNGLEICTQQLNNSGQNISVNVNHQQDTGSKIGFRASCYSLTGNINVLNSSWSQNSKSNIFVINNDPNPGYNQLPLHINVNIPGYKVNLS